MITENWKGVTDFPMYQVSDLGRVRSLPHSYERRYRNGTAYIVTTKPKIIRGWLRGPGQQRTYKARFVALRRGGHTFQRKVAHLVLQEFVGPRPPCMEACHNDGNPSNNRLSNLRWDTHVANVRDSIQHGTKTTPPLHIGDSHPRATLTEKQIAEILSTPLRRGTKAALARKYGVSQTHIARVLKGTARISYGYTSHLSQGVVLPS